MLTSTISASLHRLLPKCNDDRMFSFSLAFRANDSRFSGFYCRRTRARGDVGNGRLENRHGQPPAADERHFGALGRNRSIASPTVALMRRLLKG